MATHGLIRSRCFTVLVDELLPLCFVALLRAAVGPPAALPFGHVQQAVANGQARLLKHLVGTACAQVQRADDGDEDGCETGDLQGRRFDSENSRTGVGSGPLPGPNAPATAAQAGLLVISLWLQCPHARSKTAPHRPPFAIRLDESSGCTLRGPCLEQEVIFRRQNELADAPFLALANQNPISDEVQVPSRGANKKARSWRRRQVGRPTCLVGPQPLGQSCVRRTARLKFPRDWRTRFGYQIEPERLARFESDRIPRRTPATHQRDKQQSGRSEWGHVGLKE